MTSNPGSEPTEITVARLRDQVALVTGGASGIGMEIATRFKREGARVIISDIDAARGARIAAERGFHFLAQDVCDEARWDEVVHEVESRFERLNILINNAGILGPITSASPENTSLANWRRIFAVNVESVFLGCRAAIRSMRRRDAGGSIVNLSSVAGLLASPFATAYGASKATVRHLTKSVAQHCAKEKLNVRCNSIHPGNVRTPLWDAQAREIATALDIPFERVLEDGAAEAPLGDFTRVEDIAAAAAFLCSSDARLITGTQLIVDGGMVDCDTYHFSSSLVSASD